MKKDKCLVPHCQNVQRTRGLCATHYVHVCSKIVARGLKTWEQLEEEGKVLTSRTRRQRSLLKEYFGV
jgi:hypothetical protein